MGTFFDPSSSFSSCGRACGSGSLWLWLRGGGQWGLEGDGHSPPCSRSTCWSEGGGPLPPRKHVGRWWEEGAHRLVVGSGYEGQVRGVILVPGKILVHKSLRIPATREEWL